MKNLQLEFIIWFVVFHSTFHFTHNFFTPAVSDGGALQKVWMWAIIVNINIYLFDLLKCTIWFRSFAPHFYSIAPVTFLSVPIQKAPSHVIIILAVGAMSRDMCSGPGRVGVFKYIPTAQSPFTLNVTSIIVTDSHNYSPHLWLMICISICICGRHWVGANYMSHIVLKVPN